MISTRLSSLAVLCAALILCGCPLGVAPDMLPQVLPDIAYASTPCDTVGRSAYHAPYSSGSIVALYAIHPDPSSGLVFDPETGVISGIPTMPSAPMNHTIIATNTSGADTAVIRLCVVPAQLSTTAPPWIAYDSPHVDTTGASAAHPAILLGGQVTSYALLGSLPAGLSLNTATGLISGTPATTQGFVDYFVIAAGPGGKDTALIRLAVVLKPAPIDSTHPELTPARPLILYDSPVSDTVDVPASHPLHSLGGAVTSYSLLLNTQYRDSLPPGMTMNTSTGLISGTPPKRVTLHWNKRSGSMFLPPYVLDPAPGYYSRAYYSESSTHAVIATGPGGKDTAEIEIRIVWYEDVWEPEPGAGSGINLTVNLGASPGIVLSRLVVTLTSSFSGDTVIRDTVVAGSQGFAATSAAQTFTKGYALKPLRHWTVVVKTIGQGTTVHADSVVALNLLAGESRNVTLSLPGLIIAGDPPEFALPKAAEE